MPSTNGTPKRMSNARLSAQIRDACDLLSRIEFARRIGSTHDQARDLWEEAGYPRNLTYRDYQERYERGDISQTIVELPAKKAWQTEPTVEDLQSERWTAEFQRMADRLQLWNRMQRAHVLSRIGRYGVLLLGLDDVGEVADMRSAPQRNAGLLYVQPYSEGRASVERYVLDPSDERFGLPLTYAIKTGERQVTVHWQRVIHVAEDLTEDEVLGKPALRAVYNRLLDLDKVAAGSGESYWRAGVPAYAAEVGADADVDPDDEKAMSDEIDEFIHRLRRVIRLRGGTMKTLNVTPSDPQGIAEVLFQIISATTRIPKRILTGSERGELASTQDHEEMADVIQELQTQMIIPTMIRPFIDRMVTLGTIQEPRELEIEFPDPHAPSERERVEITLKKAQAVQTAFGLEAPAVIPTEEFLDELGWDIRDVPIDDPIEDDDDPAAEPDPPEPVE